MHPQDAKRGASFSGVVAPIPLRPTGRSLFGTRSSRPGDGIDPDASVDFYAAPTVAPAIARSRGVQAFLDRDGGSAYARSQPK
jgi:hypothetical protein